MAEHDRRLNSFLTEGGFHGLFGAAVMVIFVNVALAFGFPVPLRNHPILLNLIAAALAFFIARRVARAVVGGSGAAAQTIYMPSGASTAYTMQYSHIDTLEARGDIAGAVSEWERISIAEPGNPWPLIRAGELYHRTLKEPALALERFRAAREVTSISIDHRLYVTQKIVDLYLGPINEPGRALVELRRLVETFPDRREAQFAREAIARLKSGPAGDPFSPQ